ncbi:MAG: trehalose-6-phosphate synthase [candidate division Zixibacteria bacterium]|nr:trehalose-6-phosphate synthase [candidate division Zixibacteria bacterium]
MEELKPIIASNRLPIKLERIDGNWQILSGTGGLVTALAPVLRHNDGVWVGWPGAPVNEELERLLHSSAADIGYQLKIVDLTEKDIERFYRGFSNEALWPLFHDLIDHCSFDIKHWETYQQVNYKFAKAIADTASGSNLIWVQDYHLIMTGYFLKEMGFTDNTAFFLHIPFPPQDIFMRLPWRQEILEAMLCYRLIGFQTERDRRNFVRCVKALLPEAQVNQRRKYQIIKYNNQLSRIGAFPISIDYKSFNDDARSKDVNDAAWYFHERFPDQKIIVGIDRLDYTKGIPHRLLAFENCLERYPELRRKITLVEVVVPSRTEVPEYQMMKKQIDEMVGRINGRFTEGGWVPIHYIFGTLDRSELLGCYKASEIALITPLKDGMNLVAKEYCASHVDDLGVLILSEFAGAASRLDCGAILVNPYNVIEVADAIFRAYIMDQSEQKNRMRKMRSEIRRNNVFRWVEQFVATFELGDENGYGKADLPVSTSTPQQ